MIAVRTMLFAVLVLPVAAQTLRADSFTISQWYHDVGVSGPAGDEADYWTALENPCVRSILTQLGSSKSSASLHHTWAEQFGSFLVQSQQEVVGVPGGSTVAFASGRIWITPSVDLSLWLHSSFAYNLHGQMQARLSTWVSGGDLPGLFSQTKIYDTVQGPPYSGTFQISAPLVLPAGNTWVMGYAMQIYAWDGSTGQTGTGTGSVSFEISPEPATLALLAPLLLAVSHRAARRRRAPSP